MGDSSALWDKVRNDSDATRWLIVKANEKATDLEIVGTGEGGWKEFMAKMDATQGIVNGGIRIAAVDERGAVKSIRWKFLRFVMITSDVSALRRAKATNVKAQADNIFNGTHATFDITETDDVTQEMVVTKLHNSAGAHQPNNYEFEVMEEEGLTIKSPSSPTAAPEKEASGVSEGETPLSPSEPPASPASPQSKMSLNTSAAETVELKEDISIEDAWRRIQDDNEGINWLVCTYDGKNASTARLVKAAKGDLSSFKGAFEDDKVMYGGFRCAAIDDSGSVKSIRAKYIFIAFIGSNVKTIIRASAGQSRGHFENILRGTHISINLSDADDLTEEDLVNRLQAAAGAHKPNGYDFTGKKKADEF